MDNKPILAGLNLKQLTELLSSYPRFRSRQIHEWICRGAGSFEGMGNLPLGLRRELGEKFTLISGEICSELSDKDGTLKIGIKLKDSCVIEAVILNDGKDRKTACLSVQAGCPAGCVFCKTGSLGFKRNLTYAEIVGQFLRLRGLENDISHIVIMGMGEPMFNLEELGKALGFIMDKEGLNISKRRITLSTSGIISGIEEFTNSGPDIRLAVSLTSARDELRQRLMPISRENPLARLKETLLEYQRKRKRRITLEMVLLGGINTGKEEAAAVAEFSGGLDAVVNLIPWNHVDGLEFDGLPLLSPEENEISNFALALEKKGVKVTHRMEKGQSISGACGQLGQVQ